MRTVESWLLVLASQLWPLVEEVMSADGPVAWRKLQLSDEQFAANVEHLQWHAEAAGRRPLKTKAQMQRQHQRERLVMTHRSAVPRGN
ncbi:hypothetical protein [Arthrobacter ipis]|uniref:hypothetical protein n=1 Tax=Arthrobacter ipis TaxID=2716202 RepID=UPI001FE26B90|nr:hypothetical protein [Arthrobacter ipis]